jgi:universal stress protein A
MSWIKKILVTTDFSATAHRAFGPARELAEKFGASIILAHVEEDRLPPLVLDYAELDLGEILRRQKEHAREKLDELAPELGSEVRVEVAVGTPHVEIVNLAEQHGADLVVMATHGRGFLGHAILGSTAERVLRHAPCPVLIVRDATKS